MIIVHQLRIRGLNRLVTGKPTVTYLSAAIFSKRIIHTAFKAMAANSIAVSAVVVSTPITVVVIPMALKIALSRSG
jgi:hypothetical protein